MGVIFSFQWRHSVESIRVGHWNCKPASSSQFRGDLTDFGWFVMRVVNRTNRNKNFVEEIASCTSVGPSDQWWRWISPSQSESRIGVPVAMTRRKRGRAHPKSRNPIQSTHLVCPFRKFPTTTTTKKKTRKKTILPSAMLCPYSPLRFGPHPRQQSCKMADAVQFNRLPAELDHFQCQQSLLWRQKIELWPVSRCPK